LLPRETGGSSPGSASLAEQVSEPTALTGQELARGTWGGGAHQGAVAQQPSQGGEAWLGGGKIQGAKIQAQRLLSGCAQQDWAAKPGLLPCTQHFAHRSLRPEQPVAIGLGLRTAESHAAQSGML